MTNQDYYQGQIADRVSDETLARLDFMSGKPYLNTTYKFLPQVDLKKRTITNRKITTDGNADFASITTETIFL